MIIRSSYVDENDIEFALYVLEQKKIDFTFKSGRKCYFYDCDTEEADAVMNKIEKSRRLHDI